MNSFDDLIFPVQMAYIDGKYIRVLTDAELHAAESKPVGEIWAPETPEASDCERDELDLSDLQPEKLLFDEEPSEGVAPASEVSTGEDTLSTFVDDCNRTVNTDADCAENHESRLVTSYLPEVEEDVLVANTTISFEEIVVNGENGLTIGVPEKTSQEVLTAFCAAAIFDSGKEPLKPVVEKTPVTKRKKSKLWGSVDPVIVENYPLTLEMLEESTLQSGCAIKNQELNEPVFVKTTVKKRRNSGARLDEVLSQKKAGLPDSPSRNTRRKINATASKKSTDLISSLSDCPSIHNSALTNASESVARTNDDSGLPFAGTQNTSSNSGCLKETVPAAKTASMEMLLRKLEWRKQQNENAKRTLKGLVGFMFNSTPSGLVEYDPFKLQVSHEAGDYGKYILRPQCLINLASEMNANDDSDPSYTWNELRVIALNAIAYNKIWDDLSDQAHNMIHYINYLQKETESFSFKTSQKGKSKRKTLSRRLSKATGTNVVWKRLSLDEGNEGPIALF